MFDDPSLYISIYESELRKVNHKAHRIFSFDETGITAVQYT
jgi:hypothetical protein